MKTCNTPKTKGPVLLHVITKKGKGYKPAETDTIGTWHGTGPYKINTGDFVKPKAAAPSWSGLVSGTVQELAREDDRIVAITPAMPVGSKLEGFAKEFPERMFDVGIAEQHAATMAAGMALQGMKPFLAIYSTFCSGRTIRSSMTSAVKTRMYLSALTAPVWSALTGRHIKASLTSPFAAYTKPRFNDAEG